MVTPLVTNGVTGTGLRRPPLRRQERSQVLLGGHRRQPREHIPEISQRIDAMTAAGDDDRVDDGRAFAGIGVPDEEPVLFLMLCRA